ncbi:sugar phosphate isomerase/epimerase family protein [Lutimonas zeaxanthinifaciens]|uniref:sugar phosphate isomerase/epimerase family protein n=1 Tax=Lutimonas zeaxanthinifaciens TaxID=3060215 RepID=UPI00265CE540|nr:sugar phosphate isomerase/epimerase family protein [Lutimonas sp. YSD2104]WKK66634.1 sugar phosphate isomerase/epimerase family protein [Lutimonas sp. YSD2104]
MTNSFKLSKTIMMVFVMAFFLSCNSGPKSSDGEKATEDLTEKPDHKESDFKISLAQWSLHKTYFGGPITDWGEFARLIKESPDSVLKGDADPMDFPELAASYGIKSIELVNTFYFTKVEDMEYWSAFKKKCEDSGVSVGLIMCDLVGNLADADPEVRLKAVEDHYKWVDLADFLGAKSIRVNAGGEGTAEEVAANAVDGLSKLGTYGASKGINIIVENHGGYSSNGEWLSEIMKKVGMENVGTLPDFGNFCVKYGADGCEESYDKYKGMAELMPFAKGVSAKSNQFDENGNEVNSDYLRMMKIVKESGFKGYVGIEYEGVELSEDEGIKATKALLEKVFEEI